MSSKPPATPRYPGRFTNPPVALAEPVALANPELLRVDDQPVIAGHRRKVLIFSSPDGKLARHAEDLANFCKRRGDQVLGATISANENGLLTNSQRAFLDLGARPAIDLQYPAAKVTAKSVYPKNSEMVRHLNTREHRLLARTDGKPPFARSDVYRNSDLLGFISHKALMEETGDPSFVRRTLMNAPHLVVTLDPQHTERAIDDISLAHVFMLHTGKENSVAVLPGGQKKPFVIFHPEAPGNQPSELEQSINLEKDANILGVAHNKYEVASYISELVQLSKPRPSMRGGWRRRGDDPVHAPSFN